MALVPKISLVISTYNWPQALELVLLALEQQTQSPHEILIADDGSTPTTRELIEGFIQKGNLPLKHIWHADMGFRKTMILNKAIHQATGNYMVQIDGDVIPNRHFIQDHSLLAEAGFFIRGTRARLNPQATRQALDQKKFQFSFCSQGIEHRNNAIRSRLLLPLAIKKSASSHSVRGSNLAFWKSDFIRINGYNNDLTGWGHEDEELAARLVNAGVQKKKVKLAAIQYHLYHPEASQLEEGYHKEVLDAVRTQFIIECKNGLNQVSA